ncbi:MAG: hypothetical protein IJS96_04185 [Schwartzia sp.]|nr:hypothetical protein [Schwartzia sp. (in: firmicutes)]
MPPVVIIVGLVIVFLVGILWGFVLMMAWFHYSEELDLDWLSSGRIVNRMSLIAINILCLILVVGGFLLIGVPRPS